MFSFTIVAMITRRSFLKCGAAASATLALPWTVRQAFAARPARSFLTKYIQPLPLPGAGIVVATPSGMNEYAFTLREIARQLHPNLPPTPIWAYDDGSGLGGQAGSFGMAVVAQSGTALDVSYTSNLPEFYPDWIPVDTRLTPLGNHVRMMTHLHGGFVNADSDGNPAITPNGFGPGDTQTVHYSNQLPQMPASLLWFHDHGLGATRLNVFAGLAAAYIVRDQYDTGVGAQPDRHSGRRVRNSARDPGPPIQQRRKVLLPDKRHRRRDLDRRVFRRRDAGQRQGLAISQRGTAHVPFSDLERLQCADPEPRSQRFRLLADRSRGRHVGYSSANETFGAGSGRASRCAC